MDGPFNYFRLQWEMLNISFCIIWSSVAKDLSSRSEETAILLPSVWSGKHSRKNKVRRYSLKGVMRTQGDNTPPRYWMRDGLGLFINLLPNVISLTDDKSCTRVRDLRENWRIITVEKGNWKTLFGKCNLCPFIIRLKAWWYDTFVLD